MTVTKLINTPGISPDLAMEDSPLAIRAMTVIYNKKPAIFSVDLTLKKAAMTAIIGPNGAGKSTLLKAALGIIKPIAGTSFVYGQPLAKMRARIAYVPQRASVDWDFPASVRDVVAMGLYRKLGLLGRMRDKDHTVLEQSLERVGMLDFADRQIGALSGGQQQRVFLARALAQEAEIFLLDEPFAGVDVATERAIIKTLKELSNEGRSILAVHHDLSTVPEYFDEAALLNTKLIAQGPIAQVFNDTTLKQTYGGALSGAAAPQRAAS